MGRRRRCGCGVLGLPNTATSRRSAVGRLRLLAGGAEKSADLVRLTDEGEDAHAPLAGGTLESVDAEGAEELRPGERRFGFVERRLLRSESVAHSYVRHAGMFDDNAAVGLV